MNHISLQSLILSLKDKKINTVKKSIIEFNKNIDGNQYNGWKFWDNCSSYFN